MTDSTLKQPAKYPTPREQFQSNKKMVEGHISMVWSDQFAASRDAALLEYQRNLSSQVGEGTGAASAGIKLRGVMEFIELFTRLADATPPLPKRTNDNLTY